MRNDIFSKSVKNRGFSQNSIAQIYDSLAFHSYQLGYHTTCISYFSKLPKFAQKIGHF